MLLRAARERVPDDPDLLVTEATYLAWARRFRESLLRYDSVIAVHPEPAFDYVRVARARTLAWAGRFKEARDGYDAVLTRSPADRDAQFGLAQLRAWSGDLLGAARGYEALLRDDPDEPRVLIALASVRHWQGRPATALRLLDRSATRAPGDGDALAVRTAIRASHGLQATAMQQYSEDSDGNLNRWSTSVLRTHVGDTRAALTIGSLAATDAARDSRRRLVEGVLSAPVGAATVSASLGLRQLAPALRSPAAGESDGAMPGTRQVMTWRGSASMPLTSRVTAAASVAGWPLDEVATLLGQSLDVRQQELSLTWRPTRGLVVASSASRLSFSDENTRHGGSLRVTQALPHGLSVGAYGIGFGFAARNALYFSPAAFRAAELSAGWARESASWSASVSGGYGVQRVDGGLPVQSQWHLDARATRHLGGPLSLEAFGGRSTSAAASAVGAYRYDLLGVGLVVRPL